MKLVAEICFKMKDIITKFVVNKGLVLVENTANQFDLFLN